MRRRDIPQDAAASTDNSASQRLLRVQRHLSETSTKPHNKLCTAEEAVDTIKSYDTITVSGFVGTGCPEELLNALRSKYRSTGYPNGLKLFTSIASGDGKGRGMDALAEERLLSEMVYAWAGIAPGLTKLIRENKIKAWNLPFGCVTQMIRDRAAGREGPLTTIGTGTFVDPAETGGKKNKITTEDIVKEVHLNGKRLLWYRAPDRIDVALLRGSTADIDGNISFEREALLLDTRLKAMAARNSGGTVIVQVERLVERGSIPTRTVHIPGALVDKIVVSSHPNLHQQILTFPHYDPSLSGECRIIVTQTEQPQLTVRKVIAHRSFFEIVKPRSVVNLGVGMPEGVAEMAVHYSRQNEAAGSVVLTTEAGVMGGFPCGGIRFGAARNPIAHLPSDTILDYYNGGGLDVAFLGMAEVDREGNVNVSDFEGRMPGCGGFIDISQSAKTVIFMGTHTSQGLQIAIRDGKLKIVKEGNHRKFRKTIKEKTFSAASSRGRRVLYVTERAVFGLNEGGGLMLLEVAPGMEMEAVIQSMDFRPNVASPLREMDARVFVT